MIPTWLEPYLDYLDAVGGMGEEMIAMAEGDVPLNSAPHIPFAMREMDVLQLLRLFRDFEVSPALEQRLREDFDRRQVLVEALFPESARLRQEQIDFLGTKIKQKADGAEGGARTDRSRLARELARPHLASLESCELGTAATTLQAIVRQQYLEHDTPRERRYPADPKGQRSLRELCKREIIKHRK